MKRGLQFGIFVVIFALSAYAVFATSWNLAPSTVSAGDTISLIAFNVSSNNVINTTNTTNLTHVLVGIIGTASSGVRNVTNISLINGSSVYYNDSFTTTPVNISLGGGVILSSASNSANFTVNFTLNSSATYNVTVGANVTALTTSSTGANATLNFSTLPYNSSLVTINESTAPTAIATCSPSSVYYGTSFPCTCTGTDSGATDSGVASAVGTSTSSDGTSEPKVKGDYVYTCTVTDNAGNVAVATAEYTILGGGGSGFVIPTNPKRIHSWTKITPGVVEIMKDFSSEFGVKQIEISVNNNAQNVKITVTKYDSKPAEVSVSKTGKVYQYLQIDAENLENNLDKATIQFKIEKSWVSTNGLDTDEISAYKFDESSLKWNQLQTAYASEDSTYYYYNAETDSFSYFALAEGSVTDVGTITGTGEEKTGSKLWLWILIIVVVLLIAWYFTRKKRRR